MYFGVSAFSADDDLPTKTQKTLMNIAAFIPPDALGLYISGLSIADDSLAGIWVLTMVALLWAIVIRILAKASTLLIILTVVSFVLYTYGMGSGLAAHYGIDLGGLGAVILFIYGVIMTWAMNSGYIK
ncbi:MAG: hypothetical protein JW757_09945 [Anaerolineales bacterium]|nr:hypothetical protein [Anaerolineales bacterium]